MIKNLNKALVEIPGQVRYEKAIVVFNAEDNNGPAYITIKDRNGAEVRTVNAFRWENAAKGWNLFDQHGTVLAHLEQMTGCGCGGMRTIVLDAG